MAQKTRKTTTRTAKKASRRTVKEPKSILSPSGAYEFATDVGRTLVAGGSAVLGAIEPNVVKRARKNIF